MSILRSVLPGVLFLAASPLAAWAQGDGARVYEKGLAGGNAVTFWPMHESGNANPLDPTFNVSPTTSFEANLAILGYTKTLSLFDRSTSVSLLVPVGDIKGDISGAGSVTTQSASGFGDPMLQFLTNLYGAPAMTDLPSVLRYEPEFTLDVLADVAFPVGQYHSQQAINIGQNRWYGRIGFPMMLSMGPWIPGEKTTFELLPAVWFFGENNDFQGQSLTTKPMAQIEAHLTRDLTETLWGSIDAVYHGGAKSKVNGVEGDALSSIGVGLTLGFKINDNLQLGMSYFTTVNDNSPGDLKGSKFMLTFTYFWHPLLEGQKRLSHEGK
jgi:Putative MetA-pathway of phenol degradation